MRSVYKNIFLLFFALIVKSNYAQVSAIPYYQRLNFNGSFSLLAESDERSIFYVVDLSQFSSDFEKRYFFNQAFKEKKIVRIDAGNMKAAWFKAEKIYTDSEIQHVFLSLKQQTIAVSSTMTADQKTEWINKINK